MTSNYRRANHVNSLAAYYEGKGEMFTRRETQILQALSRMGRATDRAIRDALGFPDMNAVRPRITELIDDGVLEEVGTTKDHITERNVRLVAVRRREQVAEQLALGMEGAA